MTENKKMPGVKNSKIYVDTLPLIWWSWWNITSFLPTGP